MSARLPVVRAPSEMALFVRNLGKDNIRSLNKNLCKAGYRISVTTMWRHIHNLTISRDHAEAIIDSLGRRADWEFQRQLIASTENGIFHYHDSEFGDVHEISHLDLDKFGISMEFAAKAMMHMDHALYPNEKNPRPIDAWLGAVSQNKNSWRIFASVGKNMSIRSMMSYWILYIPKDQKFDDALLGNLSEKDVVLSNLKRIGEGKVNIFGPDFYMAKAIEKKRYGNKRYLLGDRMVRSFEHVVNSYKVSGHTLGDICVRVYSTEGERLARRYNLTTLPERAQWQHASRAEESGWCESGFPKLYRGGIDQILKARYGPALQ